MTCQYTISGCSYPQGECSGACMTDQGRESQRLIRNHLASQQPEALRLAKILEDHYFYSDTNEAAAELRRLHAENSDYGATIDYLTSETAGQIGEIVALKEQRDELLEALREMVAGDAEAIKEADALGVPFPDEMLTSYRRAVAAITKAGGAA